MSKPPKWALDGARKANREFLARRRVENLKDELIRISRQPSLACPEGDSDEAFGYAPIDPWECCEICGDSGCGIQV